VHAVAVMATELEPNTLNEWQECRTTIARFDGFLADTRKCGFTLVTVLLTANALVVDKNTAVDRPAASIVIMALLFALFMLDNYYWDLVRGAVSRARELETPPNGIEIPKITGAISTRVADSHATALILAVYVLFVLVAAGIGLTAGLATSPTAPWGLVLVLAVGAGELVAMGIIFLVVQPDAPPSKTFFKRGFGKWVRSALRIPADPSGPAKVPGKAKVREPQS
jgi:hypothetical protein